MVNRRVNVVHSEELEQMRLCGIVGCKGKVAEHVFGHKGKMIGYMVCLDKSFQGECLWFVPKDAVADEEDSQ